MQSCRFYLNSHCLCVQPSFDVTTFEATSERAITSFLHLGPTRLINEMERKAISRLAEHTLCPTLRDSPDCNANIKLTQSFSSLE